MIKEGIVKLKNPELEDLEKFQGIHNTKNEKACSESEHQRGGRTVTYTELVQSYKWKCCQFELQ